MSMDSDETTAVAELQFIGRCFCQGVKRQMLLIPSYIRHVLEMNVHYLMVFVFFCVLFYFSGCVFLLAGFAH